MVLDSKKFIPEVYSRERDMQVFTTLIDILLTCCKFDIDSLYRLYNANECPIDFLKYLGDTVNYKYDNSNTVTSNRKILDTFMTMIKHKGAEKGLLMATALCLTSLDISKNKLETANVDTDYLNALVNIDIYYDYENAKIIIDYPNTYTQVRYLLDYVRPVGMLLELRSIVRDTFNVPMAILAQVMHEISEYNIKKNTVDIAKVNFSETADNNNIIQWEKIEELKQSDSWEELKEMGDFIDFNN